MIARPRPPLVNQSVYPHSPNDRIDLLALGDHHADTGNHHVDDPVTVVIFADTPVCVDGRPAAWPANSCPDDDVLYPGHPYRDDDEGLTQYPWSREAYVLTTYCAKRSRYAVRWGSEVALQ